MLIRRSDNDIFFSIWLIMAWWRHLLWSTQYLFAISLSRNTQCYKFLLLVNAPYSPIVVFWLINYPHVLQSNNVCGIVLYNRQLFFFHNIWANLRFSGCSSLGEIHYEMGLLWTVKNKLLWNESNVMVFIQENEFESVVCKMTAIFPDLNVLTRKTNIVITVAADPQHQIVLHSQQAPMTSSKRDSFRVTGPLWRESTGHRWIPLIKVSDGGLWCFLWSAPEQTVEQKSRRRWFETPSRSLWRHCKAQYWLRPPDYQVIYPSI